MEKLMYMMMIEKSKTYNKMTKQVVMEHVENIRKLDDEGKLEICGVFKGYPGMAGMYILKTESREEAEEICKKEPSETCQTALFLRIFCIIISQILLLWQPQL